MKKIYILRLETLSISDDERLIRGDTKSRAVTERELLESKRPLKEFMVEALGALCDRISKPSADDTLFRLLTEGPKKGKAS